MRTHACHAFCRLPAVILAFSLLAQAAFGGIIFFSSTFDSTSGWTSQLNAPPASVGATLETSAPFVVVGTSMGSYMSAYNYPTTLITPASAAVNPDLWLGFLLRNDSGTPWLGGVGLMGGTNNLEVQYNGPWFGQIGSYQLASGAPNVTLINSDWSGWATNSFGLTDGQQVAVLAHIYDISAGGAYDTADLWVQSDLTAPLFQNVSQTNAVVYGFDLGNASSEAIRSLRLAGEFGVQSYDNLVLASSSAAAISFLQDPGAGSVPEPGTWAAAALLVGTAGFMRWRKRAKVS
ncbi:MAG: hypothetical protein FGM15_13355 [Chthoniobacterales bacterium]|nr:hypothetical protein [Chthoniobacterales bacterium]